MSASNTDRDGLPVFVPVGNVQPRDQARIAKLKAATAWVDKITPGEVPELWLTSNAGTGLYVQWLRKIYGRIQRLHREMGWCAVGGATTSARGLDGAFRLPTPPNWREMVSPGMVELLEEAGLE